MHDTWKSWLTLPWVLLSALGAGAQTPAPAKAVRVALMTFNTDDHSYRSSLAAVDLATLLQAELSGDAQFEWIERGDLKAAEKELELDQLGLQDAVGALRRGRYAAADWIVTGSFSVATNGAWALTLEVIDVAHADALATRQAEFSRAAHPTLKSVLSQSSLVAAQVRAALASARQRWGEVRNRRSVALLMLLDAETYEPEIAQAVEKLLEGPEGWRVLRVGRAQAAFSENEMILLGLVDQDRNAWEKIADAYVWGRVAVRHPLRSKEAPIPLPVVEPVLEMKLWNGRGQEQTIAVTGERVWSPREALAQLPQLARRAPTNLVAALNSQPEPAPAVGVRERIAQSLFENAKTWRRDLEHWSRWKTETALQVRDASGILRSTSEVWAREEIMQQMRMLETACFFDPQSQGSYELLLRIQSRPGWEFSSNELLRALKQCEGWGHYYDRFGLSSMQLGEIGAEMDPSPVAQAYVVSALFLVGTSIDSRREKGLPRDMSEVLAQKWIGGFATELVNRVLKTMHEPTTKLYARKILLDFTGPLKRVEVKQRWKLIEALWPTFVAETPAGSRQQDYGRLCEFVSDTYAELGRQGEEKALLDALDKPKGSSPVRLPRAADFNLPRENSVPRTPRKP